MGSACQSKILTTLALPSLLSYRIEGAFSFSHRDCDPVECEILENIATEGLRNTVEILSSKYSCDRSEVLERIEDLAKEIIKPSAVAHDFSDLKVEFRRFEAPIVTHLTLELTAACNMRCRYCYGDFGGIKTTKEKLSAADWIKLLEENCETSASGKPFQLLNLTGGEPTLHEGLCNILSYSSGRYMTSLFTNCMHVTPSLINEISNHDSMIRINTSFDSVIPEIDERMRGPGHLRRIEGLRRLDKLNIPIMVNVGVWQGSLPYIKDTIRYFVDDFENVHVRIGLIEPMGRGSLLHELIDKRTFETLSKSLVSFLKDLNEKVVFEQVSPSVSSLEDLGEDYECNGRFGNVIISPQGQIKPCSRSDQFFSLSGVEEFNLFVNSCSNSKDALTRMIGRASSPDLKDFNDSQSGCLFMGADKQVSN